MKKRVGEKSSKIKLSKKKINQAIKTLQKDSASSGESKLEEEIKESELQEIAEEIEDEEVEEINSERLREFLSSPREEFLLRPHMENVVEQTPNLELQLAALRRFDAEERKEEQDRRDPLKYKLTPEEKYSSSGAKLYSEGFQRDYEAENVFGSESHEDQRMQAKRFRKQV